MKSLKENVSKGVYAKSTNENAEERATRPLNVEPPLCEGYNVFVSDEVRTKQFSPTISADGFETRQYDKNGKFIRSGFVTLRKFSEELCPNIGSAVGAVRTLIIPESLGNSPKEVVRNMIASQQSFYPTETFQGGAARYSETLRGLDYNTVIIRDRSRFGIMDIPQNIVSEIYE